MTRVALITGGSMGLGAAVVERLVRDRIKVVSCARHITGSRRCDVGNPYEVQRLVQDVLEDYGRLDVLVCCAGIYGPIGRLEDADWLDWVQTIQINLLGTVQCCRAVIPIMRRQGYGKIVTLSGGGNRPLVHTTAYNASKAAVVRFTEALAVELAGSGVDVNAVAPGALDTRMSQGVQPADPRAAMARAVDLIAWLASDASDGVSGRLFSAVWDDWATIPTDVNLSQDDYRMRRVVPTHVEV
jgi:NAD(P)-dependent dehydrogenase (short-subunit alcohol dehydrogenase family)